MHGLTHGEHCQMGELEQMSVLVDRTARCVMCMDGDVMWLC